MKNQCFLITSLQPWDYEIGTTVKNTAIELSKQNRVLYLSTPIDHATWLRGEKDTPYRQRMDVIKRRKPAIRIINENLTVVDCPFMVYSINFLPTEGLFDFFNKINNKKIAKYIHKVTQELNFTNIIHLIDTDIYRSQYLKELIRPAISIYYCRDYVIGTDYFKKNGERLEEKIAQKADIVLANSTYFAERFKKINPTTYPLETGVNLELYDASKTWEKPSDLEGIPGPIIGYVGAVLTIRLDLELLYKLAQKCIEYSFVYVGPEDEGFQAHAIHQLKNVYFLGHKKVEQLPAYMAHFDVCTNPQIVNEITIGNYPLKIDEYLAMGKATVATKTHTMEDIFSEHVFLPSNEEEYVEALSKAVSEAHDPQKRKERIAFGHSHSWANSINKIYKAIEEYNKKHKVLKQ